MIAYMAVLTQMEATAVHAYSGSMVMVEREGVGVGVVAIIQQGQSFTVSIYM